MEGCVNNKRILIVGDRTSIRRAGVSPGADCEVELAASIEEAVKKQATKQYDRVIFDPAFLNKLGLEVIGNNGSKAAIEIIREPQVQSSALSENTSMQSLAYFDRELKFIWVNSGFEMESGYLRQQLVGKPYSDLFKAPDIRQTLEQARDGLRPHIASGEPIIYKGRSGSDITHCEWAVTPLIGRGGRVHGIALSLSDETACNDDIGRELENLRAESEKRKAEVEEKVRQLEDLSEKSIANLAQLEAVMASMTDALIISDLAGNIINMNPAGLRLHGFRSFAEAQKHLAEYPDIFEARDMAGSIIPLDDWPTAKACRGETVIGQEMAVCRIDTGKEWIGSYSGAPVKNIDGEIILGVVTIHDITEEKRAELELKKAKDALGDLADELRGANEELAAANEELASANEELQEEIAERTSAEEALRESEERFRNLADNISQLAWMADESGWIFWYNRRWFDYTGTTLEEMEGWGWQKVHHPDYVQNVTDKFKHSVEIGEFWEDTFPLRSKDGHYRWFLSRAIPIKDEQGKVVRWFGTNTDVTELRETEERVRILAQRLESHMQNSPLAVIEWDTDYRITRWSDEAEQMFGWVAPEMMGKRIDEVRWVYEEDWPKVAKLMEGMNAGIRPRNVNPNRNYRKDGSIIWCEWYNSVLRDEDENMTSVLSLVLDVTDRELAMQGMTEARAEAERRTAELQAIMETMPGIVFIAHDPKCNNMAGSRTTAEILKLSPDANFSKSAPEDEKPMTFTPMRDGVEIPAEELPMQRAAKGEDIRNYEMDLVYNDGSTRTIFGNAAPLLDENGQPRGAVGAFSDITARRVAERDLVKAREEAERRAAELQAFLSGAAEGLVLFDVQCNILSINDAAGKILGFAPDEMPDDWLRGYKRYTLDGDPMLPEQLPIYRAVKLGETVRDMRLITVRPDGREIITSVSSSPVRDTAGNIVGGISIFREVGEQVEFERKQRELLEREHHISEVLQQALIPPQHDYETDICKISVKYEPALTEAEVGGDFYDVFDLGEGRIGILVGDIAGKGLPAAIQVAAVRYAVRSYAYVDPSPAKVMTLTNDALCRGEDEELGLLTAFFTVVDTRREVVTYSIAGHEPPIFIEADGEIIDLDRIGGCALGIAGGVLYQEECREMHTNDVFVVVTDGVTEARRGSDLFGRKRMIESLSRRRSEEPGEIARELMDAAKAHAQGRLQDDAAIVVFKLGS